MSSCLALIDDIISIVEPKQATGCYLNSESLCCDCCNTKQIGKTNIYHCAKKATCHKNQNTYNLRITSTPPLQLCWKYCFVLLNVAQYLNGEDIYLLKTSITERAFELPYSAKSLQHMFDNVVKQLALQRLEEFDRKKHIQLFEMATEFIKQTNTAEYIQKRNKFYWIYDMVGAKEPSLKLINCRNYNNLKNTDWHRDDHRTFLTREIFNSGNLYLITNILKFIKVNKYSLTNRYGSVNQIDKILLKLILHFAKSLKIWLPMSKFIEYNTLFLEFAYFNLYKYIPYIRHEHFLHKLLNREIHRGNFKCVAMLRNKCKATITINSDPPKLFQTFRNPQYCINIWSLMAIALHFDIKLLLCLKACYDVDKIEANDLLNMAKLMEIVNYFKKPLLSDQVIKYDKIEEIVRFWKFAKDNHHILMNRESICFVEKQINAMQQQDSLYF
eukprot:556458_1